MGWKKKLTASALLISGATITIHMINKFIYFSSTLDNLLSNPSGSYYEWKFGKIYYTKRGTGKPILLIHDLTSYSSGYEWNKVVEKLSKTNTVYCIDLLGCGRSDKPNLIYTNYLYVQLITDFIKHVIGDKTDVIATGESGSFAIAACQGDSSIINQIVLVNPVNLKELSRIPTKRTKFLTWFINIPIFGTFLYNIITKKEDIEKLFETTYYYHPLDINKGIISTYYESAHCGNASSKHLFASQCGKYTTINLEHCLKSLTNSVFIITGEGLPKNKEIAEEYKTILPSIEIETIKESKYLIQLEKPDVFIEQVQIFLSLEES